MDRGDGLALEKGLLILPSYPIRGWGKGCKVDEEKSFSMLSRGPVLFRWRNFDGDEKGAHLQCRRFGGAAKAAPEKGVQTHKAGYVLTWKEERT
jgi:hypothetical protein